MTAIKNKIWLSSPHMGGTEQQYVSEAFETNWIAPLGPHVNGFEEDIASFLNKNQNKHVSAAALISGTAALHLAMVMLKVQPGDTVLVQSFTFCGTTNPAIYQGANLVFIDSETDTWNMCPEALKEAIQNHIKMGKALSKLKAIVPVHLYGMPAKMTEIQTVADQYGIPIIEDAAEALGSFYKNRACGTFGIMAALSFNGNKIITTSGGGALVAADKSYIEKAKFLSTQARDAAVHYQHSEVGYNYRLSNVLAGIGRGQMEVLETRVAQRRANNKRYRDYFRNKKGIRFQNEPSTDFYSNYWLTAILVDPDETGFTREVLRFHLEKENIEARPLWKPMHIQPIFTGSQFFGIGNCEKLFKNGLCLPSGSNLTDDDFSRIFECLDLIF
jgi:dTDP-4-amino-4,6-dideoxygalactose transaminase